MPKKTTKKKIIKKPAAKKSPAKKKTTPKKPAPKPVPSVKSSGNSAGKVDKVAVRMYRAGTGDFFILQFMSGDKVTFKMMIDCGCIHGGKAGFKPLVDDLISLTGGEIDLLVVTHEHADHINGFDIASEQLKNINFKKVWFAWTESKDDHVANDYRKNQTGIKMAITSGSGKLNGLVKDKYYDNTFKDENNSDLMIKSQKNFVNSLTELNELNFLSVSGKNPTMEDLLRESEIIKKETEVKFLYPGDLIDDESGTEGIRFFILGPPKNLAYLSTEEKKGEGYLKREKASTTNFTFVNALTDDKTGGSDFFPFEHYYELTETNNPVESKYKDKANQWRNIDNDWLYSAGSLALRFQKSINNTSLVIAIQFTDSERILLFPGDAEYGNWISWHDGLEWSFKKDGKDKKVNAEYILNNTVFYKVGHHLSQNGTAKAKGFEMMTQNELTAMATLDFKKINTGWLNTMPNDILGADIIHKTKGKLYFIGDSDKILKNIKTKRVSVSAADEKAYNTCNDKFKGKFFIDCEVTA